MCIVYFSLSCSPLTTLSHLPAFHHETLWHSQDLLLLSCFFCVCDDPLSLNRVDYMSVCVVFIYEIMGNFIHDYINEERTLLPLVKINGQ